jgi:hypothetical protein
MVLTKFCDIYIFYCWGIAIFFLLELITLQFFYDILWDRLLNKGWKSSTIQARRFRGELIAYFAVTTILLSVTSRKETLVYMRQYITYLKTSRKPMIQSGGRYCALLS